jgi:hypothetical protein
MSTFRKKRKYGRDTGDTSHTFFVSLNTDSSFFGGPVAVVDKVSADYRRAMSQKHNIRPPTPPLESFFLDNFKLDDEGFYDDISGDLQTQPITIDFSKDAGIEHGKVCPSMVSRVPLLQFKV